jgi:hypothetical protein
LAVHDAHIVERCVVLQYFRHERFPMYGAETSPTTTTPGVPAELFMMLPPEDQAQILNEVEKRARNPKATSTAVDRAVVGMPTFAKVALGALAAYGGYVLVTRAMAGGMYTPSSEPFERAMSRMNRRR